MDSNQISNLIMGEYNNSQPYKDYISTAQGGINRQTNKRVRDLLSRYSTTGMGRSGIGGAALNDVYSTAGENLQNVSAQGATMEAQNRQALLSKLLGLYQFDKQYELADTDWGDVLGGIGGGLIGSALGPIGSAVGSGLGSKISKLFN